MAAPIMTVGFQPEKRNSEKVYVGRGLLFLSSVGDLGVRGGDGGL